MHIDKVYQFRFSERNKYQYLDPLMQCSLVCPSFAEILLVTKSPQNKKGTGKFLLVYEIWQLATFYTFIFLKSLMAYSW